ncbi:MAG: GNAT family N-acetyltransferase [Paracoccus sp. (in: a-proteobacteria)]|uniref:GNAT family N-acetyltransferase n=1 Tax=Paracoccus sp. TaxID=267 RepID=UPI0026E08080|nr:GNAT family N-acetyltransferase [Paracoccus sp. (in: a-proteobacteria)]MDO5620199.1 GNAT family N-acetyltransferase [Paracoccus sp. (in: a-proteobacteria)]
MTLTVQTHRAISDIPAADWDHLAGTNPFTSHRFLAALETSGSVGEDTGWLPAHLSATLDGHLAGVAPLYLKTHSQGEYIFDHAWADAYTRAGGDYYPKLQCAIPFTPATGPRLLSPDPDVQIALLRGMAQVARNADLSGVHVTFCTESEAALAAPAGFLPRVTEQFHWENRGYNSYDDFLAALSSRHRKALRKERARAQSFGGSIRSLTGEDLRPAHWDAFWRFYQDTGSRKWGRPYLTRAFFDAIHQTMRDDILLVLAERDGQPIAGALNFIGPDALYGRYWGCLEHHPDLHFELCYHQAIDWAIAHQIPRVEAGAQGDHKLARGYTPAPIHSLHWVADPGFYRALDDYLTRERQAIGEELDALTDFAPFRRGPLGG